MKKWLQKKSFFAILLVILVALLSKTEGRALEKNFFQEFSFWILEDGTVKITGYEGRKSKIVIPDTVIYQGKEYPVTCIGELSFSWREEITEVILPKSLISIEDKAFWGCRKLKNIVIPESVEFFGTSSLEHSLWLNNKRKENPLVIVNNVLVDGRTCSGKVVIPHGVKRIADGAFGNCEEIIELVLPDSVISIGKQVFWYCTKLKHIIIPNSVFSIGEYAFLRCDSLKSLELPESIQELGEHIFHECYHLEELILPDFMKNQKVRKILFYDYQCCRDKGKASITYAINGVKYKPVGKVAFVTGLTREAAKEKQHLVIPDTIQIKSTGKTLKVVSIGKKAFQNTNLSSVEIGKNIKMIYKDAFRGCGQLKNFTIYTKNLQFVGKNSLKGTTSNLRIKVPKKKLEEYQKLFRYLPGLKKNVVFQSSYLW